MGCKSNNTKVSTIQYYGLIDCIRLKGVCTGLIFHGEARLLAHEHETRLTEGKLRREARIDLTKRGIIGTESEIAKWKEERAAKLRAQEQAQAQTAEHPPAN